jgi:uncharacterized protein
LNKNYNNIGSLENARYINIQTYKRNMQAISTPVWFIIKDDKIFFRTSSNSGKIKRIKSNNKVKLAPCNILGKIKGQWHEGIAKIEKDIDNSTIEALNKKYGISSLLMKVFYKIKKIDIIYVSIELGKNINK